MAKFHQPQDDLDVNEIKKTSCGLTDEEIENLQKGVISGAGSSKSGKSCKKSKQKSVKKQLPTLVAELLDDLEEESSEEVTDPFVAPAQQEDSLVENIVITSTFNKNVVSYILFNWKNIFDGVDGEHIIYTDRINQWQTNPAARIASEGYRQRGHKNFTPGQEGIEEAVVRHTFSKEVDKYLSQLGISNCIPGKVVYTNMHGKRVELIGLFSYAFDQQTKKLFHRCFTKKSRAEVNRGIQLGTYNFEAYEAAKDK